MLKNINNKRLQKKRRYFYLITNLILNINIFIIHAFYFSVTYYSYVLYCGLLKHKILARPKYVHYDITSIFSRIPCASIFHMVVYYFLYEINFDEKINTIFVFLLEPLRLGFSLESKSYVITN